MGYMLEHLYLISYYSYFNHHILHISFLSLSNWSILIQKSRALVLVQNIILLIALGHIHEALARSYITDGTFLWICPVQMMDTLQLPPSKLNYLCISGYKTCKLASNARKGTHNVTYIKIIENSSNVYG